MKKKLLTVVTVAAVISLTLSTYAVVMCAQAFSRKLQNITGANESAGAAAVTDPVCASSDDTAPTVRAGIEGDVVYLLLCANIVGIVYNAVVIVFLSVNITGQVLFLEVGRHQEEIRTEHK